MEPLRILDAIKSPADLKVLTYPELAILAQEIREEIIATCSANGGHIASSLGAVEIVLAAHRVLNCPDDKLLFDVGHQAYAHKLVTGRLGQFSTLRTYGGISGFTKPEESPFDAHPSGHASDSLSVAAGYAKAAQLDGSDRKVVAVIGDASLSGGMAFEALNYIGQAQLPMVIILNDNMMSISRNVGALMKHLGNMRADNRYRKLRDAAQEELEAGGAISKTLLDIGKRAKESAKQFFLASSMMFESLGITCTAPIDGHDIRELEDTLRLVLQTEGPVLVHVVTRKGAGYGPAEQDPERFHGVGPFDIATGAAKPKPAAPPSFTSVFGETLLKEGEADDAVMAITAAMEGGTGLKPFAEAYPQRFIDVGIAEENAVALASGLAFAGKKPVVAIYSTFLQRSFDQIVINCALPQANVVLAIDRAGLVGEDGATHHGAFDLVYMRTVPHMKVLAPADEADLANALHTALALEGPVSLRYPRGNGVGAPVPDEPRLLEVGKSRLLREGSDACILAFGTIAYRALEAAEMLADEGISVRVVDMLWAKPLDEEAILAAAETGCVVTAEEGAIVGGCGEGVIEIMSQHRVQCPVTTLALPDSFVRHGSVPQLLHEVGLDSQGIAEAVRNLYLQ